MISPDWQAYHEDVRELLKRPNDWMVNLHTKGVEFIHPRCHFYTLGDSTIRMLFRGWNIHADLARDIARTLIPPAPRVGPRLTVFERIARYVIEKTAVPRDGTIAHRHYGFHQAITFGRGTYTYRFETNDVTVQSSLLRPVPASPEMARPVRDFFNPINPDWGIPNYVPEEALDLMAGRYPYRVVVDIRSAIPTLPDYISGYAGDRFYLFFKTEEDAMVASLSIE